MSDYDPVSTSACEAQEIPVKDPATTKINRTEFRLYKRRWMILCLFICFSVSSLLHWIQYCIIADVVVKYYGISYKASDWSALIFLLLYIPFSFPGSYLLDKLGLRLAVLLGMFGTCIGAWVKVASVAPDRYWVLLVGQSLIAIFQVFILPVPPKLAAVWFGAEEVSSACSLGVLGNQLGIAVGFLIPPMLIDDQGESEAVGEGLHVMTLGVAVITSVLMLVVFVCFQSEPPTPPSSAQLQVQGKRDQSDNFVQSLRNLAGNTSYLLLLLAFSINCGVLYAISISLNQIVLKHHPDSAKHAGTIGLVIVVAGMVGSVVCGVTLDKFNRYKETTIVTYTVSIIAMIAFTFTIGERIEIVYCVSAVLGFCMTGMMTIALELGVELTYPEPEGTSGGLQLAGAQVLGILFTYLHSFLFNSVGDVWANLAMCGLLLVGEILVMCIKFNLHRHSAQINKN